MNSARKDAIQEELDDFSMATLRYLDGLSDEDEVKYIEEHLESDSQYRKTFVRLSRLGVELKHYVSERADVSSSSIMNDKEVEEQNLKDLPQKTKESIKFQSPIRKIILSIAASIAIFITVFLLIPSNNIGEVAFTSNGATITRDNKIIPASNSTVIKIGDIIHTEEKFSLKYDDNTLINIPSDSTIELKSSKTLFLKKGKLTAWVEPQDTNNPFIVETPNGNVEVIGTGFDLLATDDYTKIRVEKGKVKFGEDKKVLINAGEAAVYSSGELKFYGLIDEKNYHTIKEDAIFTLDLSKKIPENIKKFNKKYLVDSNFLGKTIFRYVPSDAWPSPHLNASSKDALFSVSGDMKINFTFKTTCEGHLEVGIINSYKLAPTERIGVILYGDLLDSNRGKWQTLSLPIKSGRIYYNGKLTENKEKDLTEKLNTNNPLFLAKYIRLNTHLKNKGKDLEVSRIWITK